jgi:hypothetical protein
MKNTKQRSWQDERRVYFLLALLGAVLAIVFHLIRKNLRNITENELATVNNLVLTQAPEVRITNGREKILLHVKGHDKLFQIADFDFSEAAKRTILQNIKVGDTVVVKLDSSEFATIGRQTIFDNYTEIHSLIKNKREYLSIQQANRKAESDLELGFPVGLFLFVAGLVFWRLPARPKFSPTLIIGIGVLLIVTILRD